MPPRRRSTLALTAALLALSLRLAAGQAPQARDHVSALGSPRVDLLDGGNAVLTFDVAGDLPGILTMQLVPATAGDYTGTWAFMIAGVDNTDPATGVEPAPGAHGDSTPTEGGHHQDFVRLVHRGDLSGKVTSASFLYDGATVADLAAALSIARGGLEFAGLTGSGAMTLTTLTLRFEGGAR